MTIKEFSEKYGIDYQYVYNATWKIARPRCELGRYQYDEEELFGAVREMLEKRVQKAKTELDKAQSLMAKIVN